MKKIIILMAAVFTLSACGEKNYSVDDFLKDKDLMHKIIAKCRSGELDANSSNCSHAFRASNLG